MAATDIPLALEQQKKKKKPAPGRGGVTATLSEDEALLRCIGEIVDAMVQGCRKGESVDLNALKSEACKRYGLSRAPKLVELIAALPESEREMVLPRCYEAMNRMTCVPSSNFPPFQ